jgi:hypothetical protein
MHFRPNSLPRWLVALLIPFTLTARSVGGEIHRATGGSKIEAMEKANRAANEAAKGKNTGWKPARLQDVVQNPDGTWTARANSANHRGSLRDGGYCEPTDSLPSFKDATPQTPPAASQLPVEEEPEKIKPPIIGLWKFELEPESREGQKGTLHFREDGTVEMQRQWFRRNKPTSTVYKENGIWRIDGSNVTCIYRAGTSIEGRQEWKLSGNGRELSPTYKGDRRVLTPSKQKYLFFAAIYERSKDRSHARIVEDRVDELEDLEAAVEANFRKEIQAKHQTSNHTWVIHVIPDSTQAIVYSFKMDGGKTEGVAVAEGSTQEEAERRMEGQLKNFLRTDAVILRRWPAE